MKLEILVLVVAVVTACSAPAREASSPDRESCGEVTEMSVEMYRSYLSGICVELRACDLHCGARVAVCGTSHGTYLCNGNHTCHPDTPRDPPGCGVDNTCGPVSEAALERWRGHFAGSGVSVESCAVVCGTETAACLTSDGAYLCAGSTCERVGD